jgi:hypothetical protein
LIGNIAIVLTGIFVQCHNSQSRNSMYGRSWFPFVDWVPSNHNFGTLVPSGPILRPWSQNQSQFVTLISAGPNFLDLVRTHPNFVILAPAGPILSTWSQDLSQFCHFDTSWSHFVDLVTFITILSPWHQLVPLLTQGGKA